MIPQANVPLRPSSHNSPMEHTALRLPHMSNLEKNLQKLIRTRRRISHRARSRLPRYYRGLSMQPMVIFLRIRLRILKNLGDHRVRVSRIWSSSRRSHMEISTCMHSTPSLNRGNALPLPIPLLRFLDLPNLPNLPTFSSIVTLLSNEWLRRRVSPHPHPRLRRRLRNTSSQAASYSRQDIYIKL